ncbi:MAG: enoyl-CoA hydratase [Deltaproteobacteria bacterium]|nr:enoyl-CoA hydratase [Deltaproteobacteria bacterium]
MAYANLIYEKKDHVVTLTLNRPDFLNALDSALLNELGEAADEINADHDVRVAVVTGAGRGFCSGGDLKATSFAESSGGPVLQKPADHWAAKLLAIRKPTIAAVNGVAVGGGLSLALAFDVRIASEKARFSAIFAKIGMSVLDGNGWLLPRAVGLTKALELLFTADMIDAAEAERIGIVSYVVPHEQLMERALEMAAKIAANPPVALQLTKNVVYDALGKSYVEHLPTQWAAMQKNVVLARHDVVEGGKAFAEKRAAKFTGVVPPE